VRNSVQTLDLACVAGLVAFALVGGYVTVRSASSTAHRVEQRNQAVEARLAELKRAQAALDQLDVALRANQSALETLRKRLPESQGIGQFLAGLDAMMARNDVTLRNVTPGNPIAEELCTRTPLVLTCRGTFANLHAVLRELEQMDRLVRVDQASISGHAPASGCEMSASCSVYGR